ncbi:MAG: diadenosine tetraphosphate hydrolase [Planctomycetota bacterium]|nr:diadenosine tetraphosphate hydrolase [Planctomycetota bacterium]
MTSCVLSIAACGVCEAREDRSADARIAWSDDRWILRHHEHPAPLAGWFKLESVAHIAEVADLDAVASAHFGVVASASSRAVRLVTGADRVYSIAFGEGARHIHMHLIPRMRSRNDTAAWNVADWYRRVANEPALAPSHEAVAEVVRQVGIAMAGDASLRKA